MGFVKARKTEAKLRLALAGPAGSGKTFTGLTVATALADGKPVAVIDTERGSASKYADLFDFDVLELDHFHPDRYIEAIQAAQAEGYGVIVIDSLTHAWEGKGGLLEIVEGIAKRSYGGNTFRAWADGTPMQNRLIDAITGCRMHVIATMRTKNDYAVDKDERSGKMTPHKVGLAVKQREGVEYEFDIFGKMTQDNDLIIEKTRCPALTGQVIHKPGADLAATLGAWLAGAPQEPRETVAAPPPPPATSPAAAKSGERRTTAAAPARHDTRQAAAAAPYTASTLRERAAGLGIEGPKWGDLWRECHGELDAINGVLNTREREQQAATSSNNDIVDEDTVFTFNVEEQPEATPDIPDLADLPMARGGRH